MTPFSPASLRAHSNPAWSRVRVGDAVTGRELLDDRDAGQGLGLVALKAADLQGEPVPVDEQAGHDLGPTRRSME